MADDDLIKKTKMQIRQSVIEIEDLARRGIDAPDFFHGFLRRVISCLAASGGAVWMSGVVGNLQLAHSISLPEVLRDEESPVYQRHAVLLQKTFSVGEGALIERHSGEAGSGEPANPTSSLLVLGVLKTDRDPKGVAIRSGRISAGGDGPDIDQYPAGLVEIFQRPGAPPTTQRGYLKFVGHMCEIANRYLQRRQ